MKAITRKEKIMSGENLTPITRKEMFLAKAAGQNVKTPEPATREEMFLSKISGASGGVPINNQDKTITENGVYQADEGYTGLGTVTVEVASTGGGDIDALIDKSITEITSNVESIGNYACQGCGALKTVNFPLATSIGDYAFAVCLALETTNFPLVTSIGDAAFNKCTALKKADFPLVTSMGQSVFVACSALETVNFPLVTSIGSSTFQACTTLETVDFPLVTSIRQDAFYNCKALKTANFPLLTSIDSYAFYYCELLSSLIIRSETICNLSNKNAFSGSSVASGTGYIYVPRALVEDYKAATNWSNYASQFRALEDYTVDGTINGELDESKI